ncbi:hypothetical protein H0O00_04830 [Candidatus Micrarchaeota archaeon]|nr:hypothetical protein [Candidatus Micrarchaeota archaeon]
MAGASVARREIVVPKAPTLAMANRFQRYKPETEKTVRGVEVKEDETLRQLKEAWKACGYTGDSVKDYPKMLKIVKKLEYSAKDVVDFNLALVEFQGERDFIYKAGLFLSALMNNSKDSEFVIHTNHLAESINFLGYKNTKNITVNGNAGNAVGGYMCGGSITIKEDAGDYTGQGMKGGEIRLLGDYKSISFHILSGGKIFHKGKLIVDK